MSAVTVPVVPHARPLGRRLANVVRLHLANPFTVFVTPALVLGLIFLANWVIWWIIATNTGGDTDAVANASQGFQYSGASAWTLVYMMVVAIQAMNLSFPFALGFGSTRRDFALGTGVTFIGLSALYAGVYTVLAGVETATGGWGVGGAMFNAIYFGLPGTAWPLWLFHVFAGFLLFFGIGTLFGAIFVRWRTKGLILFFAVLALALMGAATFATTAGTWGLVGEFFGTLGFTGSYALAVGVAAVAGVCGFLVLRRATPRS